MGEICVGLGRGHLLDGTFNADLTAERLAVPEQGGAGVGRKLTSLARVVVRIPAERRPVVVAKQHDSLGGRTVGASRSRERTASRSAISPSRLVHEPIAETGRRDSGSTSRDVKRHPALTHETSANCQLGVAEKIKRLGAASGREPVETYGGDHCCIVGAHREGRQVRHETELTGEIGDTRT